MKSKRRNISKYLENFQKLQNSADIKGANMSVDEVMQLISRATDGKGTDKAALSWDSYKFGFAAGYAAAQNSN